MALRPDKPGDIAAKAKRIAQTGADLLACLDGNVDDSKADAYLDELERVNAPSDKALTEVERLQTAQVWQPIETAVFNKRLLLWLDGRAVTGTREGGAGELPRRVDPTHWMPLPKGPQRLTDDEAEALMSGKRYGGELWTFGEKPK